MGYVLYAILWLSALGLDIVFLLAQVLTGVPWIPSFEALVIFNLLVMVLGPPEKS